MAIIVFFLFHRVAYELEGLNDEIKRNMIKEGQFAETNYPFKIKLKFSTFGSMVEVFSQRPLISFLPDDSMGDLLGYSAISLSEPYNLSPNPVDVLSFDKIF